MLSGMHHLTTEPMPLAYSSVTVPCHSPTVLKLTLNLTRTQLASGMTVLWDSRQHRMTQSQDRLVSGKGLVEEDSR